MCDLRRQLKIRLRAHSRLLLVDGQHGATAPLIRLIVSQVRLHVDLSLRPIFGALSCYVFLYAGLFEDWRGRGHHDWRLAILQIQILLVIGQLAEPRLARQLCSTVNAALNLVYQLFVRLMVILLIRVRDVVVSF